MTTHTHAKPLGGRILTPTFLTALALFVVGALLMLYRFLFGLAAISNLSDGYPWGIWKPLNVVTITGIGAGAYGLALVCYVFNRKAYHALVRPALLTGALAYTVGGASVLIDLGRWWNILKVPGYFWRWNGTSILLEVALCVLSYMMVLWIEVLPAILGSFKDKYPVAGWLEARIESVLPFLIALGVLLPTMHQSSLGALFIISSTLHPLWHTGWLGAFFLVSCLMMGYAAVVAQDTITRMAMHWPQDTKLLPDVSRIIPFYAAVYIGGRFIDLAHKGRLDLAFAFDGYSMLFLAEMVLAAAGASILATEDGRTNPGKRFGAALLLLASGTLYRFDTYIIALRPRGSWSYFPSVGEITVALSLWSMAFCAYVFIARRFPIVASPELSR